MLEPRTRRVVAQVFQHCPVDTFVDVGANLGNYSWWVANENPAVKLMLFEPDPKNVQLLRKTIARSGLGAVALHTVALSDSTGVARFIIDDVSGAVGSLIDQRGTIYNLQDSYRLKLETTVETRVLDDFYAELVGHRVLMKVDVEGAEARVFRGASRVLNELRPIIVYESFDGSGTKLLKQAGYRVYAMEECSNYIAIPDGNEKLGEALQLPEA